MHCALMVAPVLSVMVTLYTPLSSAVYPIIWRLVSCSSTLTRTFDLEPEHLALLPGQVARVTLWGESPISGSCSQVTIAISSRGPCSVRALKSRADPGITCTGSLWMMCTDIARRSHGAVQGRELWLMMWWTAFYIHDCWHLEQLALRHFALCKLIKPTMEKQFISIYLNSVNMYASACQTTKRDDLQHMTAVPNVISINIQNLCQIFNGPKDCYTFSTGNINQHLNSAGRCQFTTVNYCSKLFNIQKTERSWVFFQYFQSICCEGWKEKALLRRNSRTTLQYREHCGSIQLLAENTTRNLSMSSCSITFALYNTTLRENNRKCNPPIQTYR